MRGATFFPHARATALKALALDHRSGGAHFVLGAVKGFYEWDHVAAEAEFRLGRAYDPEFESLAYAGWLSAMGRFAEAIEEARRVARLNPTALPNAAMLVLVLMEARQYEDALREIPRVIEMRPDNSGGFEVKAECLMQLQRYEEAEATLERAAESIPGASLTFGRLAITHALFRARTGRIGEAEHLAAEIVAHLEQNSAPPAYVVSLYAAIRNVDEAFKWLETGLTVRDPAMVRIHNLIELDRLHSDPRWSDIVRRMQTAPPP